MVGRLFLPDPRALGARPPLARGTVEKAGNHAARTLKVHKIENVFDSDFGICVISLSVMSK
jgi:hypothetical protein